MLFHAFPWLTLYKPILLDNLNSNRLVLWGVDGNFMDIDISYIFPYPIHTRASALCKSKERN